MHHIFSSIINLVIPFDDKGNPEDTCKGDKTPASLNSSSKEGTSEAGALTYSRILCQFLVY